MHQYKHTGYVYSIIFTVQDRCFPETANRRHSNYVLKIQNYVLLIRFIQKTEKASLMVFLPMQQPINLLDVLVVIQSVFISVVQHFRFFHKYLEHFTVRDFDFTTCKGSVCYSCSTTGVCRYQLN